MSSCWTRRHVLLCSKRTCLRVQHEDVSSCRTRRHVFLFNKKICLLVQQEDMSSCSTRRQVFLFNKKTCPLAQQEDMLSFSTRRDPQRNPLRGVQGEMPWEACISSADLPMLPMGFVRCQEPRTQNVRDQGGTQKPAKWPSPELCPCRRPSVRQTYKQT